MRKAIYIPKPSAGKLYEMFQPCIPGDILYESPERCHMRVTIPGKGVKAVIIVPWDSVRVEE